MASDGLLANLNESQHAAVSSFADTLAILAGPGSGKTHTLTSRTAWLLSQGLQPWNVIVATFTVKAAREMKERIGRLLDNGLESKLILGTFHSIARRYLARYGYLIDIQKDFGIADSADSLAIIKRIVKREKYTIDPKVARSRISGLKSRKGGENAAPFQKPLKKTIEMQELDGCYEQYEEALKRSNLLDYDDLLLRCVDLLRQYPSCVSNVEAVLIDEFQDTNLVQFDLMRLFAAQRKRITIVGDPDQSIYGFRAAEVMNYKRMLHQYPDTVTIALEENYRSSGAILLSALSVIKQDSSRVDKSLQATHTVGTRPVLRKLANAHQEAEWIITEIQRCKGMTGHLLDLNDFAILLRSSSLSRLIESALGKSGIAYRMVGGLRFYDRLEVKIVLDYLRVISQPDNNDALARILNVPSRRIGDATIKVLLDEAEQSKITLWALIGGEQKMKFKPSTHAKNGLGEIVNIVHTARKQVADPDRKIDTVGLIKFVLKRIGFEKFLEDHHGDVAKGRWANVEELITQASDFQSMITTGYEEESLPEVEGLQQNLESDSLTRFLANVALASEVKNDKDEGAQTPQVTISTIHAAKGLEWPVVFIPGAYQGSIPHSRAEDENEERRLLYVAMTRAKALLYMSCPLKNSQQEQSTLSPFLSAPSLLRSLEQKGPTLRSLELQTIALILRRPLPSFLSISQASLLLKSEEDDIFTLNGENKAFNNDSQWQNRSGSPSFNMGQRPAQRQKKDFMRSACDEVNMTQANRYLTTMDRPASFTVAQAQFVTARSLPVGAEQPSRPSKDRAKIEHLAKQKIAAEGQGTLLNFLGKPGVAHQKRSRSEMELVENFRDPKRIAALKDINIPQPVTSRTETVGILPVLANHRLGSGQIMSRPRPQVMSDTESKSYVFLSSSPVRCKAAPEPEPALPPVALTTQPAILPLIRPSTSMHSTTTSTHTTTTAPQTGNSKRTLGVKRSINSGWQSKKGQGFVPPTIRKPK
ncbi:P-loop containing nucleoside triphosphate hydrolase protein [Calycina marina]|uniref:DNA 3'-5' helicase n=1 Tax=Calycina marina TaxID=1763456 RepID=A0A9P7Z5I7_9HELO|nr:P-loop containing nucleoside triphosphate hydrolase protein [Calycina marina]